LSVFRRSIWMVYFDNFSNSTSVLQLSYASYLVPSPCGECLPLYNMRPSVAVALLPGKWVATEQKLGLSKVQRLKIVHNCYGDLPGDLHAAVGMPARIVRAWIGVRQSLLYNLFRDTSNYPVTPSKYRLHFALCARRITVLR